MLYTILANARSKWIFRMLQSGPESCLGNTPMNIHVSSLHLRYSLCRSEKLPLERNSQFLLSGSVFEIRGQDAESQHHTGFSKNCQMAPRKSRSRSPSRISGAKVLFQPLLASARYRKTLWFLPVWWCEVQSPWCPTGLFSDFWSHWTLSPRVVISQRGFPLCEMPVHVYCPFPPCHLFLSFYCRLALILCAFWLLIPYRFRYCKYLLDGHRPPVLLTWSVISLHRTRLSFVIIIKFINCSLNVSNLTGFDLPVSLPSKGKQLFLNILLAL